MSFAPVQSLSSRAQDRMLGLFVIVALVVGVFLVIQDAALERQRWLRVAVDLSSSFGITQGAPVRINGVIVGRVDSVVLNDTGEVNLNLLLERKHQALYLQGSQVKVDSTLGLDNVLSGTGLVFIPGKGKPLNDGEHIGAIEPKSLDQLMDEWDVETLTRKVGNILENLDVIVRNVSDNQENLSESLNNIAQMTSVMASASQEVPKVLQQMSRTMSVLEGALTDSQSLLQDNVEDVNKLIADSGRLIQTLNSIAEQVQPASQDIPQTQQLLSELLYEMSGLTRQLRQHWLLQGSAQPPAQSNQVPQNALFPADDSLYEQPAPQQQPQGEPAQ